MWIEFNIETKIIDKKKSVTGAKSIISDCQNQLPERNFDILRSYLSTKHTFETTL